MDNIIFTKGAPGSGKSTFLEKYGVNIYTICPDDLRLIYGSPQLSLEGNIRIDGSSDRKVWSQLMEILEGRMRKGDFIILDATHTKQDDFIKYKKLIEKYRYKAWCIDFSDVSLEDCLERNRQRVSIKIVPDEIVKLMHERSQKSTIPSWITALKKDEFGIWLNPKALDLSEYKIIHHIGDIQGCYTVLMEYLKTTDLPTDECFIFVGDYIDRGIENDKSLSLVLDLFERHKNCVFLEGNHERYLWDWANDVQVNAKEFNENTKVQLENANIQKSRVRNFCRHLKKYYHYKYEDKHVVVTHGGVSTIPENFKLVSSSQFVNGVGVYADYLKCDEAFLKNTPEDSYSIHGHRNVSKLTTQVNSKCFNLEGEVEFGGNLRVLELSKDGFEVVEIKNNIFNNIALFKKEIELPVNLQNQEKILELRNNRLIQERKFEKNISSFNFKKEAFYKGIWNEQTTKARGLFINNLNYDVVARSYEKFFNIGEMDFTEFEYLKENLAFPVNVYKKENGYLGLIGYNSQFDELVFTSKSYIGNDFSNWCKEIFEAKYKQYEEDIKAFIVENNLTLVFEVIDPIRDPHIIDSETQEMILLDIVKRDLKFEKLKYESLIDFAKQFGFNYKQIERVLETKEEFEMFYKENKSKSILELSHEGYVFEDAKGFMVKLKLPYYVFWKSIREYIERYKENSNVRIKQELLKEPVFEKFNMWLKSKDPIYMEKSIIELRKLFFKEVNL